MKRVPVVLSFCQVAASCQEARTAVSNPIGPSPSPIPSPIPSPRPIPRAIPRPIPPEPAPQHAAETQPVSLDHIRYPHPCGKDVTGLTSDWVLAVDRAETMRLFVYWDPTDGMEYLGSLSGQDGRSGRTLQPWEPVFDRLREWRAGRSHPERARLGTILG